MGIKGLSQFLEKKFTFRKVLLTDFDAVVIDGNNICCKLYERDETDWERGGEYEDFSVAVSAFFEGIVSNDVHPIVVLDGLRDSRKIEESCKRRKDMNSKFEAIQRYGKIEDSPNATPTLALPTFLLIIQEMNIELQMKIELHVSAGEADQLVAAISNNTAKCPVLASDSDYFMYELKNGYIPFDKFDAVKGCSLYHKDDFMTHFSLRDPMMRLMIPAKHGNDFIPSASSRYQDHAQTIAELQKYKSCENYLSKHEDLRSKYENVKSQYCVEKFPEEHLQDYVTTCDFPVRITNSSVDTHFCLIRMTTTKVNVLSSAVEKMSRESVWNCSQYIRQFLYGILGIQTVNEINRGDGSSNLIGTTIKCKVLKPQPLIMSDIDTLSLCEREGAMLAILKCNKMSDKHWSEFKQLPPELKLPVATAFYWYHTSSFADTQLLKALLFCFFNTGASHIPIPDQFSWENVHAFSQWQSVYSDALALNYMLRSPLEATNPARLFSGINILYYASMGSDDINSKFSTIQMKMFDIITSACEEKNGEKASSTSSCSSCYFW